MLWFKFKQKTFSLDEHILARIKKHRLKARAINACKDTINYEVRLKNVMVNNKNNLRLLTQIAGHMHYLQHRGVTIQQAAKETLELYTSN